MRKRSIAARKATNTVVTAISAAAATLGLFMLTWILFTILQRGAAAIDWSFFTDMPAPPGVEGGGVANAIVGTLMITLAATAMGVPFGMLAGIYLAEFGKTDRFSRAVRFVTNIMMGVPSIVIGVFVYTLLVLPMGHFSGFAGAVALAVIMFPVVTRTTEDMLQLVPDSIRESALALGAPEYKMVFQVVFRAAKGGLITGVMLAVARVSGETAPLLFTALNSAFWTVDMSQPMGNLTVTIFNYAMSPYKDWQAIAWGASLLITMAVLLLNLTARFVARERKPRI